MESGGKIFYFGVVSFCLGIFIRSLLPLGFTFVALWFVVAVALLLVAGRKSEAPSARYLVLTSLFLFIFALGVLRLQFASLYDVNPTLEASLGQVVTLSGEIRREPDLRANNTHLYIKTDHGLILATTKHLEKEFNYGDRVTAVGQLEKPEAFLTDLGRTFNYPGYLRARGVSYLLSDTEVKVSETGGGNPLVYQLLHFKQIFMHKIESLLPYPESGLSEGLLLGVKRALGEDLEEDFRRVGIIHIVVLSGYNIMIVVIFIRYVLSTFLSHRLSMFASLFAIAGFAILVGLSATVLRASLMAGLLLLAGLTGRTYFVIRALTLAGLVMLIFNPYLLVFDVGFQLSFVATLGLILLSPVLAEKFHFVPNPGWLGIREFLVATLATQFFVTPLLLYQMGQFSVVAVVANILILPMVPVSMLLTFLAGLVSLVSTKLALPIAFVDHLSLAYIINLAEWFSGLPFASVVVPPFPFVVVVFTYGVITYLIWRFVFKKPAIKKSELEGWVIVQE